jgi:DNA-binding NarL/FixJ family response regulator
LEKPRSTYPAAASNVAPRDNDGALSMTGCTAVVLSSHPLTLTAITAVLERDGVEILLATTSPDEALAACREQQPDLLTTGYESNGSDPLTWLREAHRVAPRLRSIVLSGNEDIDRIEAAFRAGASAYVVDTAEPEDLAAAIRQAFVHSIYLRHGMRPSAAAPAPSGPTTSHDLTRRELEILRLVAEGHSNGELAKRLWVTEQTIKFHLSNIYRKLGVSNRTEASRWAQINGLLAPPGSTITAAHG